MANTIRLGSTNIRLPYTVKFGASMVDKIMLGTNTVFINTFYWSGSSFVTQSWGEYGLETSNDMYRIKIAKDGTTTYSAWATIRPPNELTTIESINPNTFRMKLVIDAGGTGWKSWVGGNYYSTSGSGYMYLGTSGAFSGSSLYYHAYLGGSVGIESSGGLMRFNYYGLTSPWIGLTQP